MINGGPLMRSVPANLVGQIDTKVYGGLPWGIYDGIIMLGSNFRLYLKATNPCNACLLVILHDHDLMNISIHNVIGIQ